MTQANLERAAFIEAVLVPSEDNHVTMDQLRRVVLSSTGIVRAELSDDVELDGKTTHGTAWLGLIDGTEERILITTTSRNGPDKSRFKRLKLQLTGKSASPLTD